uniref:Uncharacterized protein n=1 Tax=Ditylenchus dipsaci TaxID=166011 RepID=A0A915D3I6_9BILA
MSHRVIFVGTTVINSERKAELVRHQLGQFEKMKDVPVFAGTAGIPADARDISFMQPGLKYKKEGVNILSAEKLKELKKYDVEYEHKGYHGYG